MVLKTEFNADIARLNNLHKVKEVGLLSRIA
jgi:putative cell wall-binding protein